MSILSTSSRLIKVGQDYSAGAGISIDNHIISVTSVPGTTYSAGDNITIEDNVINSKDWSQDIANASANAYNAAIAEIPAPFDPSYISGQIDNKLDSTAFTNWQDGQYATDLQTIEGQISNKLDESAFSEVSGSFLTAINIPESATWQDVSTTVQSNSAQWSDNTGDEEVNSFVYDNSATILDVDTTYQQNSATYLTAHQDVSNKLDTTAFSTVSGEFLTAAPADMATTGDIAELAQTVSETYQVKGDYLTTADSSNFYPANNPSSFATEDWVTAQGYITGVDLSEYAKRDFVLSSIESANSSKLDVSSFASVSSDFLVASSLDGYATESFVENVSGEITALIPTDYATTTQVNELSGAVDYVSANAGDQEVNNIVYTNSATWDSVTNKLDTTAFSTVSGDFLTTSFGISQSAHWEEATNAYEQASATYLTSHQDLSDYQTIEGMTAYQPVGDYYSASNPSGFITGVDLSPYYTTAAANTLSSMFSGAIDYVSSNAGNQEVSNVVQSNSSTWNNVTAKQNTLTFRYGTSSGSITSINGSAIVDDYTYHMLNVTRNYTASMNKVLTANSATWNQVTAKLNTTAFSTVSGTFLTAHQDLSDYAKSSALNDYQTTAGMTAYQPAGSYATTNELEQVSADITATIPSTAGLASESYVQTNSAVLTAMIDGKQDTLIFGYDEQDRISAINNSAVAAGDEFPVSADEAIQYVQTNSANIDDTVTSYQTNSGDYLKESELGYNAVDEVSAINGSAIAQYGAEKQWLVHDDTLVHASNSAQYALGVNISAVAQLLGVDETVLYSGADTNAATLSDDLRNYTTFKAFVKIGQSDHSHMAHELDTDAESWGLVQGWGESTSSNCSVVCIRLAYDSANNKLNCTNRKILNFGSWNNNTATTTASYLNNPNLIYKVVGIGRKS